MKFENLQKFDNRFDASSYLTEKGSEIWLSLLIVKTKFRKQGVLTDFLQQMKKRARAENKKIIIPTPTLIVQNTSNKLGFKPDTIKITDPHCNFLDEPCEVMIFKGAD